MLNFELTWIFWLLPLPILAYFMLPAAKQEQAAVRVPFYVTLGSPIASEQTTQTITFKLLALVVIWLSLIAAAAQPTWIGDPITLPTEGRDLMLAVDLSNSMSIEDMEYNGDYVNRLVTVKSVLNDFIERREGDRIGLILFGSQAYIQAPLTFDRKTVQQFLTESQIGFAGNATAIGDAIGLAVKRLRKRPGDKHIVILLTDGANTAGEVQPLAAAKFAAKHNITLYTVGVGADEMITPGIFGSSFGARKVNPSADLDETTLKQIASLTGGQYFRAKNPQELLKIYQLVDELEPIEDKNQTFRPTKSLFYWPLTLASALSLVMAFVNLPWRQWLSTVPTQREAQ